MMDALLVQMLRQAIDLDAESRQRLIDQAFPQDPERRQRLRDLVAAFPPDHDGKSLETSDLGSGLPLPANTDRER